MNEDLNIAFGSEQIPIIDALIKEFKPRIIGWSRVTVNKRSVSYTIRFKSIGDVYAFGFRQGRLPVEEVFKMLMPKKKL